MSAAPVYVWPCPFLKSRTVSVRDFDMSLLVLTGMMVETLAALDGSAGAEVLAATQVGDTRRVIVLRSAIGFTMMVNPLVLDANKPAWGVERDLSLPGIEVNVKRFEQIVVRWYTTANELQSATLEAEFARAVRRGIDHLNAMTLYDHAGIFKQRKIRAKYKNIVQSTREGKYPARTSHLRDQGRTP